MLEHSLLHQIKINYFKEDLILIILKKTDELTEEVIRRIIQKDKGSNLARKLKLEEYYNGKNNILNRQMKDPTKPNNKIANPYANYITDTLVGYFIGEPITYNANDKNLLEELLLIFEYNDEADENAELAKNASIYGVAYELLYMTEDGVRFKVLDPKQCIPIYDDTLDNNLIAFIRYYDEQDIKANTAYTIIEVITDKEIMKFKTSTSLGQFQLVETYPHYFNMVPIAIYKNNEEENGDFENVISLIDAYDKLESDSLNDFEYFVDAYLALYGFTADEEDIANMKERRVLLMDEGTSAEWLVKSTSDSHIENIKNRIDADIHKFAKCPNLSDQEFASNASGVAIKYKLLGTENKISIKERKFKKGLQQRLELLANIKNVISSGFDWRAIDIIFTRNIPSNDTDIANMINTLSDIVSKETLLAQIPFVDDVQAELDRLDKEKEDNPFFQSNLTYQTNAMENSELSK